MHLLYILCSTSQARCCSCKVVDESRRNLFATLVGEVQRRLRAWRARLFLRKFQRYEIEESHYHRVRGAIRRGTTGWDSRSHCHCGKELEGSPHAQRAYQHLYFIYFSSVNPWSVYPPRCPVWHDHDALAPRPEHKPRTAAGTSIWSASPPTSSPLRKASEQRHDSRMHQGGWRLHHAADLRFAAIFPEGRYCSLASVFSNDWWSPQS